MIFKLSGMDAAGKATQAKLLADRYLAKGIHAEVLAFPDYPSLTGQAIKGHLRKEWHADINVVDEERHRLLNELVFQSLMTVDRYAHYEYIKSFEHDKKRVLVLDRYYLSGIIYATVAGLPLDWCEAIHKALPRPDTSFFLNITLEESIKRRPERRDRIETDFDYLTKIRTAYLAYYTERSAECSMDRFKWRIVDGINPTAEIAEEIYLHCEWMRTR